MQDIPHWYILDRAGNPMPESELPERPFDAQPTQGDEFRPWFKQEEHIHVENGKITGIHGFGTLASVQERLSGYQTHESALFVHFDGNEDILVSQADRLLRKEF